MVKLKPCPCGKTPIELQIMDGNTYRWRYVEGGCCGIWMIEVKVGWESDGDKVYQRCVEEWNIATRNQGG